MPIVLIEVDLYHQPVGPIWPPSITYLSIYNRDQCVSFDRQCQEQFHQEMTFPCCGCVSEGKHKNS